MPLGENHVGKKDVRGFTPNNPLTQRNIINQGELYLDTFTGSDDTGTRDSPNTAAEYNDSTHFLTGTGAVKIIVNEAGGDTLYRMNLDELPDLSTKTHIDIWIYDANIDEDADNDSNFKLTVRLGTDSAFTITNYYDFVLNDGTKDVVKRLSQPGWKCIRVPLSLSTTAGVGFGTTNGTGHAGDFSDVTFMQLEFRTEAGDTGSCNIWLDSIYFDQKDTPRIVFSFDDGNDTDLTEAYEYIHNTHNLNGTSFIYVDGLNGATTLTSQELITMNAEGWDFCNHSSDALNLTTDIGNDIPLAISKLDTCRDFIKNTGLGDGGDYVAYVQGQTNAELVAAMRKAGYKFGRLVTSGPGSYPSIAGHPVKRDVIGFDPLLCKCIRADATTVIGGDISPVTDIIDQLIEHGGFGIFMFHKVVASGAVGIEINRADFRAIVDYVANKDTAKELEVVTLSEAMRSINIWGLEYKI